MSNLRILLVEDDPFLQKLYSDLLSGGNFSFETASDGIIAYQKMQQGGWDLILLDFVLPKMNALEILEKLKGEPPASPNKSVVLLTNLEEDEDFKKALNLANGHIIKSSVNPEEFLQQVKKYL